MFFVFAILSMFGYALLGAVMSYFSRKNDSFTVAFWRSVSLVFVMSPLLFFVPVENFLRLPDFLSQILVGGLAGAFAFYCWLASVKYLPVGVSASFIIAIRVITLVVLSLIFFGETLSFWEIVSILVALLGVFVLSIEKSIMSHLDAKTEIGILLTVLSGFFGALWFFFTISVARNLDPLLAAYSLESGVSFGMIVIYFLRVLFKGEGLERLSKKTIFQIMSVSSLTLIATGFYAQAANIGSAAVLGAIGTGSIVFITIFGRIFFHEKLKLSHYIGIAVIILGIVGLKIFG